VTPLSHLSAPGSRENTRTSAFTSANVDKIVALKPDLVLTFSDLQADIAADLIRRGLNVHAFNQRTVAGILDMIRMLGAMVDAGGRTRSLSPRLKLVSSKPEAERNACRSGRGCSSRSGTIR
jgi:iron complex transport system substrate-binding protein